jgi:hypothetical protein
MLVTGVTTAVILTTTAEACAAAVPLQFGESPGGQQPIAFPCAVTFSGGYLYYSLTRLGAGIGTATSLPRSLIRRISLLTGQVDTVAGAASGGQTGNGWPASQAVLGPVCGLAVDGRGDVLLSDSAYAQYKAGAVGRSRVRVVAAVTGTCYGQPMRTGHLYTIAGRWNEGYSGDSGPAVRALLSFPSGLAVDQSGNVIIADGNSLIRVVAAQAGRFYGVAMQAGRIYDVAGHVGGTYLSNSYGNGVAAGRATLNFGNPADAWIATADNGVLVDHHGNIVISDTANGELRVVAGSDGTFYGRRMRAGHIYTVVGGGVDQPPPDGVRARDARFFEVGAIAIDQWGNVIMSADGIRVLAVGSGDYYGRQMSAGHLYLISGTGIRTRASGIPAAAAAAEPLGITVDSAGNIVFTDLTDDNLPFGQQHVAVRVIAAQSGLFYGVLMRAGDIYTIPGATSWP